MNHRNGDRLGPATLKRLAQDAQWTRWPVQKTRESRSIGALGLILKIGLCVFVIVWVILMAGICFSRLPR